MEEIVKGKLVIMGQIDTVEPGGEEYRHPMALLIEFSNVADIRKAIADGVCRFEFGSRP